MPELIVSKNDKVFFRVPLLAQRFTVGRSSKNDLTLPDEEISRQHFAITSEGGIFSLTDLDSSVGTKLNSQIIKNSPLADGNEIGVADWKIVFKKFTEEDAAHDDEIKTCITRIESDSVTKVLQLDPIRETIKRSVVDLAILEEGQPSRKFRIKHLPLVIGGQAECDLVLKDEYISSRHCRLEKRGENYTLVDLDSTNGTFINGSRICESVLTEKMEVKLGKSSLKLIVEEKEEKILPLETTNFCGLVGKSDAMRRLFSKIQLTAPHESTVLIHGETGSGKELVARALHELSARKSGPYVILNCGAISPNLIESELFGHEKGSFTGAVNRRLGAFEQAQGGTLFLDEVGELPLELQPKLLRVLENQTLRRVGGDADIPVNVRVLAATHRLLAEEVKAGRFREDLFFRLYVIPLNLPPLRERRDDIPLLVAHFLRLSKVNPPKIISTAAMQKLKNHSWPGNIRELKNVLLRSLIFCEGNEILPEHLQMMEENISSSSSLNLEENEKQKIVEALKTTQGNRAQAADMLGIAKSTLFKKIKDYGLELE